MFGRLVSIGISPSFYPLFSPSVISQNEVDWLVFHNQLGLYILALYDSIGIRASMISSLKITVYVYKPVSRGNFLMFFLFIYSIIRFLLNQTTVWFYTMQLTDQ